jgi:hypothetical protein
MLKVDVLPANVTASWVVGIVEQFTDADSCTCENGHERPVTGRLQRCVPSPLLIERVHIVGG